MDHQNFSPRLIRRLPEKSTVKEDLQALYETLQELSYTQYNILKLTESVSTQVEQIRTLAQAQNFRMEKHQEDFDSGIEDHQAIREQLLVLSSKLESTLSELHDAIAGENDSRDQLINNSAILVQAAKQVLIQAGFDPVTGQQKGDWDRDWGRIKKKFWDVLMGSLITLLIGWIATVYMADQNKESKTTQRQLQTLVDTLSEQVKQQQQKNK